MQDEKFPVLINLWVVANSHERVTRGSNSNDPWSSEDTHTSWSVTGIRMSSPYASYGDITADFEVKQGDVLHLVYAIYSTGNSFGMAENGRIDYITVHKDRSIAEMNAEVLRTKKQDEHYSDWNAIIHTDSGILIPYHVPWLGYFESLTGVYVVGLTVEK
jgi:hypothetical protein